MNACLLPCPLGVDYCAAHGCIRPERPGDGSTPAQRAGRELLTILEDVTPDELADVDTLVELRCVLSGTLEVVDRMIRDALGPLEAHPLADHPQLWDVGP